MSRQILYWRQFDLSRAIIFFCFRIHLVRPETGEMHRSIFSVAICNKIENHLRLRLWFDAFRFIEEIIFIEYSIINAFSWWKCINWNWDSIKTAKRIDIHNHIERLLTLKQSPSPILYAGDHHTFAHISPATTSYSSNGRVPFNASLMESMLKYKV